MAGNDGAVAPDKHYGVVVGVVALTSVATGGALAIVKSTNRDVPLPVYAGRFSAHPGDRYTIRADPHGDLLLLVADGVSTPIVGLGGVDPAHERLPGGSQLLVKVGTGQPCP